jgi:hypothetical protein
MEAILGSISEYLVASLVVFVILFLIVAYFFTGKKFSDTIRGFFLVIASLIYSPFMYFQKSLLAVAHFRLKEAIENEGERQYLLVRFLTSLQALLAIIVIAMIASGSIKAWNSLLPPKQAREENSRLEKSLEDQETQFTKLNPEVSTMENNWTNNKQDLIKSYRNEQDMKVTKANNDNSSIEQQVSNAATSPYFLQIKRYLDQNQNQYYVARYDNIKKEALDYIKNQETPSDIKNLLNTYVENWHLVMVYKFEQSSFTEEQYRSKIQPEYAEKKITLANIERQIADTKAQLKYIQPMIKYNVTTFILFLFGTLLTALLFIWCVGLIIELLWLGVDIAGNVNRIRTLKQNT